MDAGLSSVVERLAAAQLSPAVWPAALELLATAVGGWGCRLLGLDDNGVLLDITGGVPIAVVVEYLDREGADPTADPRIDALLGAPAGSVATDREHGAVGGGQGHPLFGDFLDRVDAPYAQVAVVIAEPGLRLFAVILRSRLQGPGSREQQQALGWLIPYVAAAVRWQLLLEADADAAAQGVVSRLKLRAVICDGQGLILDRTSAAAERLARRVPLVEHLARLGALHPQSDRSLTEAAAAASRSGRATSVVLHNLDGSQAALVEVMPLHQQPNPFALARLVIVMIGGPARASIEMLRLHFGLTAAEAEVASALCNGSRPGQIADQRGVSIATVRTQISAVFGKLDVSRAAELVVKVRALL